jgi:hypothetical protein
MCVCVCVCVCCGWLVRRCSVICLDCTVSMRRCTTAVRCCCGGGGGARSAPNARPCARSPSASKPNSMLLSLSFSSHHLYALVLTFVMCGVWCVDRRQRLLSRTYKRWHTALQRVQRRVRGAALIARVLQRRSARVLARRFQRWWGATQRSARRHTEHELQLIVLREQEQKMLTAQVWFACLVCGCVCVCDSYFIFVGCVACV